jgi:hypothetical protein
MPGNPRERIDPESRYGEAILSSRDSGFASDDAPRNDGKVNQILFSE